MRIINEFDNDQLRNNLALHSRVNIMEYICGETLSVTLSKETSHHAFIGEFVSLPVERKFKMRGMYANMIGIKKT